MPVISRAKEALALRRTGASSRNVGKISFQDQVVYFENFIIVLCLLQQLRNQSLQIHILSLLVAINFVYLLVFCRMAESQVVAKQALKKLEDQLTCAICLDTFKDPKLLQCFHVYCRDCLQRLVVTDTQG